MRTLIGAPGEDTLGTPMRAPKDTPVGAPEGAPLEAPEQTYVGAPLGDPVGAPLGVPVGPPVGVHLEGGPIGVHAGGAPLRGPPEGLWGGVCVLGVGGDGGWWVEGLVRRLYEELRDSGRRGTATVRAELLLLLGRWLQ